ncbi:hypothetical protein DIJ69_32475 [Streptomyces globisporus]|nr:hypothetical protein DIJ69_32475 [Streptomyces globisporus]
MAPGVQDLAPQLFLQLRELGHLSEPAHPLGRQLTGFEPESPSREIGRDAQCEPTLLSPAQHVPAHYGGCQRHLGLVIHVCHLLLSTSQRF